MPGSNPAQRNNISGIGIILSKLKEQYFPATQATALADRQPERPLFCLRSRCAAINKGKRGSETGTVFAKQALCFSPSNNAPNDAKFSPHNAPHNAKGAKVTHQVTLT